MTDQAREAFEKHRCNSLHDGPACDSEAVHIKAFFDDAYQRGLSAGREQAAQLADEEAPTHDDGYYGGIATHALQQFAKKLREGVTPRKEEA